MDIVMGAQGSGYRYLICYPCHCHATYNLFFELKFHSYQLYYFLATGCAAVTRLEYLISMVQNPGQAIKMECSSLRQKVDRKIRPHLTKYFL